ncbi:acetolactate synthase large subunit [Phenylobacterium montanum]|uniref:Acetolactate synthase large subunit n=1 Tax=Phenylobacterium montanum TaxID=2823693 RepID=A0A975FVC4_9CAUL|nr:acetolactate synthase large subunit [Caulobacter sp. S6]QUD86158.1 acetolactate synthase large subunit [Caulobacter sp. S6]
MNGADAILATLADNGVEACFANPGTSEMHFVSALDREPRIRPVLCLFEGVVTGAADGYGRMAGKPAVTLLHLGPGYANGVANLHNARRAYTPIVNVIGDHATYHRKYDAPLTSDIEALARPNSRWIGVAEDADHAAYLAAEAVRHSFGPPGGSATLVLPADCAWSPATRKGGVAERPMPAAPDGAQVDAAARALKAAAKPVVLIGGQACEARGLAAAGRLAAHGIRVLTDTFVARQPRGGARYSPDRMPYFAEMALSDLAGADLMVLAGTTQPVAFFAYPAMPSVLVPEGCQELSLAGRAEDAGAALEALADALGAPAEAAPNGYAVPERPTGEINAYTIGASIARHMPEETVISDDAVTSGLPIFMQTRGARPHDWLALTGGAIGQGIPVAIGAAVACPDKKVLCLTGDGAGMYTVQGLWTIARESLDVTVVVFANHSYRILGIELSRTGAGKPGVSAASLLDLGDPRIDWTALARGMGLPAVRCETAEAFDAALAGAMGQKGPIVIEAAMS